MYIRVLINMETFEFLSRFFFQSCQVPQKFRFQTVQNFRFFKKLSPY